MRSPTKSLSFSTNGCANVTFTVEVVSDPSIVFTMGGLTLVSR